MRYVEAKLPSELDYIDLYCLSDIHRGHPHFREDLWSAIVDRIRVDQHAYAILNGDGVEAALKSARYGDTYRTMAPGHERRILQDELKLIRDKLLAITSGNHEERHRDTDENPLELIADHLGLLDRYDPVSVILDLQFGTRDGNAERHTQFSFYVTHGRGGGYLPGGKINRASRFSGHIHGVDGYIMGHVHDMISRIAGAYVVDPRNKRVTRRPFAIVISGSLVDWPGSYAEQYGYPPGALSYPILRLYQKRRHDEHKHMEIIMPTVIRRVS